jgi:opacity protein-like surface antigen
MKQTSKMVMAAVALLAGVSGNAWANGTEMPPPAPSTYTQPPAPAPRPVPPPVSKSEKTGPYISGSIGIGIPEKMKFEYEDIDMDSGLAVNGAIGYNFGSARVEGALGYQKHDLSDYDDDVALLTVMANAYYDFDAGSGVKPYIMGGLGLANVDMSWSSNDDDVFAWQIGAGVGIKIADQTTLDLGYRYLKPSDFDTDYFGDAEWAAHNIMVGLRYQF